MITYVTEDPDTLNLQRDPFFTNRVPDCVPFGYSG